jgi:hypothetical protein
LTPGRTAPDVSRTTPVICAWANARVGQERADTSNKTRTSALLIEVTPSLVQSNDVTRTHRFGTV